MWRDTGSLERMLMVVGSKILLLIYVVFLVRQRRQFEARRSREAFLVLFLVPAVVITLVIVLLKLLVEIYYVDGQGRAMVGTMAGIVALLAVVMYLNTKVAQKEQAEREKEYACAMAAEQKRSYHNLLRQQEDIRMMDHDMKNVLLGLKGCLASGETQKAMEKMDQLLEAYAAGGAGRMKGGRPWQALSEAKLTDAGKQGIAVESKVEEGDYGAVDDIDFCIILGNLLDNAVEAQAEAVDRHISLYVMEDKGIIYVRLENNVPEWADIQLEGTSKKDSMRHGFGIRSVREIVKRYGGSIEFEIGTGKIVAKVLLQMPS